ncbi:MAG: cytochrome c biogenesis protein ResB [Deltaproteobacteria bacterium]|nr:cytochrome c biogenesis protein ResB [Deltaproteobacteria bacterium]
MKTIWKFFSSVYLTVALAALVCIDAAWGSMLAMKYPQFFRNLDQAILLPWLSSKGPGYLPLTLWIYVLVLLVALFAVNTAVCTADRIYAIIKAHRPWQSFFPHLVHIGFFIALLGHLAGSVGGFRSYGHMVFKGDSIPVPESNGLYLRLDGVKVKQTPEGEPEEIKTGVTLLKDGSEILSDTIEINGPLIYKGIAFYHLDQGSSPAGLVLGVDGEVIEAKFEEGFRTKDGTGFRFGPIYPDFAIEEGEPFSRSNELRNPYIEIRSGGERAFLDLNGSGARTRLGGKEIRLEDFVMTDYAVLAINKDPGIWLIIAGSSVLVIGMLLLLFFRGGRAELVRQKG